MANIQGGRMALAGVALGTLAENWWVLLLRGLAAIAFGVITFFWPAITLVALTYLWGAYALADGIIATGAAISARGVDAAPRSWLGLSGVVGIFAGIIAFAYTGMTAFVLLVFIAVWAVIIGVLQLFAAIRLRNIVGTEWWLILSGFISLAFGLVLLAWPGTGALALVWTIAWYAVFFGCMLVGLSFDVKKYKQN